MARLRCGINVYMPVLPCCFAFRFNKKVFLEINLSPTHSDDMYPIITNITELCLNLFLKTTFVVLIYIEPKTPLKLNLL